MPTAGCNASLKHKGISIFKFPKLNLDCQKYKMGRETDEHFSVFFFLVIMF